MNFLDLCCLKTGGIWGRKHAFPAKPLSVSVTMTLHQLLLTRCCRGGAILAKSVSEISRALEKEPSSSASGPQLGGERCLVESIYMDRHKQICPARTPSW